MSYEEENKRTAMISFRVTPLEKERLIALAAKKGISLPELGYLAINCADEEEEENKGLRKKNKGLQNVIIMFTEDLEKANKEIESLSSENEELNEENSVLKSDKSKLIKDYNTAFEIIKANNLDVVKKEGNEDEEDNYFFGGLVKF